MFAEPAQVGFVLRSVSVEVQPILLTNQFPQLVELFFRKIRSGFSAFNPQGSNHQARDELIAFRGEPQTVGCQRASGRTQTAFERIEQVHEERWFRF